MATCPKCGGYLGDDHRCSGAWRHAARTMGVALVGAPFGDGLEFLRRLRARAATRSTPVAIVTGNYFLDDTIPKLNYVNSALRCGSSPYSS
jgi:hypothetical protein